MEQYPVPQFIEQEAKIIYFVSFRQFFYLFIAGLACTILYFILPLFFFIIVAVIMGGIAITLGFVKIDGIPITSIIWNSFGFFGGARNYTWKKKESLYPFKTVRRIEVRKIEEDKTLKGGQKSALKSLRTKVELRTK